jgi:hypothetical protein
MLSLNLEPKFRLANRGAIADEIERLIAILDTVDGDPDLEPEHDMCLAGDDGCGFHQCGALVGWGNDHDEMATAPIYGLDQSRGPVNEHEAYVAHRRSLGDK